MTPKSRQLLALAASAILIVAGVLQVGSQQNPWNLFVAWFMPVAMLEVFDRRRSSVLVFLGLVVVLAASVVGLVETLGAERIATFGGGAVCAGVIGGILATRGIGPFAATPVAVGDEQLDGRPQPS